MSTTAGLRVGVIGAGVAGVNTARQLALKGISCTVFERSPTIGGVWRSHYMDFGLQVPQKGYHFPDHKWAPDAHALPTGPEVQEHIESYADKNNLRDKFQLNTSVKEVVPRKDGARGWTVVTDKESHDFDFVVVANGQYCEPNVPEFEGREKFKGEVLHSSKFYDPEIVKGKRVVTVGFGKSSHDCSVNAKKYGALSSDLVFNQAHWVVPQKLGGLIPFDWPTFSRFSGILYDPWIRPNAACSLFQKYLKVVPWAVWRTVSALLTFQFGLNKLPGVKPTTPIEIDLFGSGVLDTPPSLFDALHSGEVGYYAGKRVTGMTEDAVVLDDGSSVPADVVLLGTGFKSSIMDLFPKDAEQKPVVDDDGCHQYRYIISPNLKDMAFVGATSDTFSNILLSSMQAKWVAELLSGSFELPSTEEMETEVDAMRKWKRSWMPDSKMRAGHIQMHQLHYYDELIKDYGGNHKRKSNPIAEIFAPYHPADYAALIAGEEDKISQVARPQASVA